MKIIKLILLLTLLLQANYKTDKKLDDNLSVLKNTLIFKLDVNCTIEPSQLKDIISNGWNDKNITLNNCIVAYCKKSMPKILKKIKHPIEKSKKLIPKFILTRRDYLLIEAYTKYLEFNGNIDESIHINIKILKGLKNIKIDSFLALIYRITIESIVRDSIFQLIENSKNFKISNQQYMDIKNSIMLDKNLLLEAVKKEQASSIILVNSSMMKAAKGKVHRQQNRELIFHITKELKIINEIINKKIVYAIEQWKPKAIENLKNEIEEFKKENKCHNTPLEYNKYNNKLKYIAKCTVQIMISHMLPKYDEILKEYMKTVNGNKLLLQKLKSKNY